MMTYAFTNDVEFETLAFAATVRNAITLLRMAGHSDGWNHDSVGAVPKQITADEAAIPKSLINSFTPWVGAEPTGASCQMTETSFLRDSLLSQQLGSSCFAVACSPLRLGSSGSDSHPPPFPQEITRHRAHRPALRA